MLRLVLLVVDLFRWLPWWGALAVLAGSAVGFMALAKYFWHRLERDIVAAVSEQGEPLADALVSVHSVESAPPPAEPSPLNLDPDDKNFDPDLDGVIPTDEAADYYWIDATIAPHDPQAEWDPSTLTLVRGDFEPHEELELCMDTALLHTLEIWCEGDFAPRGAGLVTGPQRLRMLFAVPHGMLWVKFACHFTYFGDFALPVPIMVEHAAAS